MMNLWHHYGIQAECPSSDCDHRGDFAGVKNCPKCGVEIVVLLTTRDGYHNLFGEAPPEQQKEEYTGPQLVRD